LQTAAWLSVLLSFPAFSAPPGDPVAGREKADAERCLECHGVAGEGQGFSNGSEGKFPNLNGQHPDYIIKQVQDFRNGKRKSDFMRMIASSVSDADLADIAAYFAAQPAMSSGATPNRAAAHQLFVNGDPARKLPACASCHGEGGKGTVGVGPVIGGQGLRYLEQQLQDWRNGSRSNSAGGIMNQLTAPLTEAEIEALARYVSEM
jgi:cytochrome c553